MSDLDHLLDDFVADVRSQTRAPGASTAIAQARRRRKVVAVVGGVAAVAVIAAGSALAAGILGGSERRSSLAAPPTAAPEPPAGQEVAAAAIERYQALHKTLTTVPGWAITDEALSGPLTVPDRSLTVLNRCGGAWTDGRGGVGSGNYLGLFIPPGGLPVQWDERNFGIPAGAPEAMDRLIGNLASCTAESWRTQPIGQTGAVLAFTEAGVVWILHKNAHVSMLHVPTTDGPPPLAVQVEVADQMYSWIS